MPFLIDTDVAIHLRDGDSTVADRMEALGSEPFLSIVSRVELENGVYRFPADTARRRVALDALLAVTRTLPFDYAELAAYRSILDGAGFSRSRISDRMIAATALANGLTLITMNGADYRDIPVLETEIWPSPTPPPS